jgi:hypothetical protein
MGLYPDIGIRNDGTTYPLKSNQANCKKSYADYLKTNVMTHDEIITALPAELVDKQRTGHTHCQPGLLKWINERRFEQYRGKSFEPAEVGYGETLI